MYFETLQQRLLDFVRWRVRNGELTERRLAGLIGVSQPHMHNVLKGIRTLSPGIADRILKAMEMSVLDLVAAEDAPLGGMPRLRGPTPPIGSGGMRDDGAP
jgi:transcriptional regulator with XRE-family HTH domain